MYCLSAVQILCPVSVCPDSAYLDSVPCPDLSRFSEKSCPVTDSGWFLCRFCLLSGFSPEFPGKIFLSARPDTDRTMSLSTEVWSLVLISVSELQNGPFSASDEVVIMTQKF